MRKWMVSKICVVAFLLAVVMAGCSDADKNAGTGAPGDPLTPPTVTAVTPPDSLTPICPNTALITAMFSKAMNPATINSPATTFTLTSAGASVPGTVNYATATNIATFTPLASLAPSATFTATITTGAKDTFGNPLAANFVWTFATSAACPPPAATGLGAACTYGILAGSTVTSTGATHIVNGDLGLSPGGSVTGFQDPPFNTYAPLGTGTHTAGPGLVSGTIHITDAPPSPNDAASAQAALTVAYLDLKGRTAPAPATVAGDLGGLRLAPGIYKSTSTLGITGTLTLDGGGNANAVWIFQIASGLTTLGSSNVVLAGQAQASNIFWQVGSSATLGTGSTFNGSILALTSISLTTGATLNGRALAQNGAVTLDTNMVNVPSCP
jgi:hypothetical protein